MPEQNGVVLDCKCTGAGKLNEMKQIKKVVRKMQNPQVLRIIIEQPTQTYKNNPREGVKPPDVETGFVYHFGGRVTHQCVDERDVPRLLERVRDKNRVFVVEQNHIQPDVPDVYNPAVNLTSARVVDPFSVGGNIRFEKQDAGNAEIDPVTEINRLTAISGIGTKTATSIVNAGFTFEDFLNASADNVVFIQDVAEKATINAALVARAIEGSKEVESEPLEDAESDDTDSE